MRVKKWKNPEMKPQTLLLNRTVINKLKAYAWETDQSFEQVIKGPYESFQEQLLELSRSIDNVRVETILKQREQVLASTPFVEGEPVTESITETAPAI